MGYGVFGILLLIIIPLLLGAIPYFALKACILISYKHPKAGFLISLPLIWLFGVAILALIRP